MNFPTNLNRPLFQRGHLKYPRSLSELVKMASVRTTRLAVGAAALAWLPALALSSLHGLVSLKSFLFDLAAQTRLLVVIPLLILTEPFLMARLSAIAQHFLDAELVKNEDISRFERALTDFKNRENSVIAKVLIVLLVYMIVASAITNVSRELLPLWCYETGFNLSAAGSWYLLVSLPIVLYLLLRWVWRQLLWGLFLRSVAQMDLRLVAAHPDRLGGLGFLETCVRGYFPFGFAIGAIVAGRVANQMLHQHESVMTYKHTPLVVIAGVLPICLAPLGAFVGQLVRTRLRGTFEYGNLALSLGQQFEKKWLHADKESAASILTAPDFSATIDLYSVVANVREVRLFPISLQSVLRLTAATPVPAIPVMLLAVPFDVLLEKLLKLFL